MGSLVARLSETARITAEREEGEGLRRLAGLLNKLPDSATVVLRPKLGFMQVDCCVFGAGKLLVINTLHYRGVIEPGEREVWVGPKGGPDLGRPDRRAFVFCDRLAYAELAKGLEVEPVVVCTEGPVDVRAVEPQTTLVQWAEAESFFTRQFPAGVAGFPAHHLVRVFTS